MSRLDARRGCSALLQISFRPISVGLWSQVGLDRDLDRWHRVRVCAGIDMRNHGLGLAGSLLVILLTTGACGASPGTGAKPSPPVLASPLGSSVAAASPTQLPRLSPDEFWTGLFSGDPDFTAFLSIDALIKYSDAVVLASLESVSAGKSYDAGGPIEFNAIVTIHVERVLHGSLSATTVPINVVLGFSMDTYGPLLEQLKASMPHERGILFLQNLASWDKQMTGASTGKYDPSLYCVISAQGIIREANGVAIPALNAPGTWPQTLKGQSFDAIVSQVVSAKPDK